MNFIAWFFSVQCRHKQHANLLLKYRKYIVRLSWNLIEPACTRLISNLFEVKNANKCTILWAQFWLLAVMNNAWVSKISRAQIHHCVHPAQLSLQEWVRFSVVFAFDRIFVGYENRDYFYSKDWHNSSLKWSKKDMQLD